jgi:hypothetical protein
LPDRLKQLGIQIECATSNRGSLTARLLNLKTPVLVACLQDSPLRERDDQASLGSEYDRILYRAEADFEKLSFNPDTWIGCFLQDHGVNVGNDLNAWVQAFTMSPAYVEGCALLDTGLRFAAVSTIARLDGSVFTPSTVDKGESSRPVATMLFAERQQSDARKHVQGSSAERMFARHEADILFPQIADKWRIIQRELERINEVPGLKKLDITNPKTKEALADRLHVARHFDGLGYDVLTVEDGHLVRVEVKSSTSASPQFFLSEPERRNARMYLEKKAATGERWKLILYVKQGGRMIPYDATVQARHAIMAYDPPSSGLQPMDYVVQIAME